MLSKRILTTSISISLIFHVVILALAGIMDMSGDDNSKAFWVDLKEPSKNHEEIITKKVGEKVSLIDVRSKSDGNHSAKPHRREDTVSLDSIDIKYCSYLEKLREKIRRNWSYPQEAYRHKEEGTTIVKFSLGEDGSLQDLCMAASSGFNSLDMEALDVIRSSAPYTPLPKSFNLSKLNVVAKFQYSLTE